MFIVAEVGGCHSHAQFLGNMFFSSPTFRSVGLILPLHISF